MLFEFINWQLVQYMKAASQSKAFVTNQIIDNFIKSIQAMHFVRMKCFLTLYGKNIVNCLESRTRMPSIFFAIQLNDQEVSIACIKSLLKYQPNIHFRDTFGNTYLHHCCCFDKLLVFQYLHKKGVSINQRNIHAQSIFFMIAKYNHLQILHYLEKQGQQIDINQIDIFGRTPLFYAAQQGHLDMCEILMKMGAKIDLIDKEGHDAQYYARKYSKFKVLQLFFHRKKEIEPQEEKPAPQLITFTLVFAEDLSNPKTMSVRQVLQLIEANQSLQSYFYNPQETPEDTQDEQDWKLKALKAVELCLQQPGNQYFKEPVIQQCFGITDYYEVIKNPIDFQTITKKLIYNVYENQSQFEGDVNRIYQNAATYNGQDHYVTELARNIGDYFKSIWKC